MLAVLLTYRRWVQVFVADSRTTQLVPRDRHDGCSRVLRLPLLSFKNQPRAATGFLCRLTCQDVIIDTKHGEWYCAYEPWNFTPFSSQNIPINQLGDSRYLMTKLWYTCSADREEHMKGRSQKGSSQEHCA